MADDEARTETDDEQAFQRVENEILRIKHRLDVIPIPGSETDVSVMSPLFPA